MQFRLQVFLEGPYDSTRTAPARMRESLESAIPFAQPFSGPPWNHAGLETLEYRGDTFLAPGGFAPTVFDVFEVVDWVLVCIRLAPTDTDMACRAGLLLSDGHVINSETWALELYLGPALPGFYHVVVYARNHLAAMTPGRVQLADLFPWPDLNLSEGVYGLNGAKKLSDGSTVLFAGDGDADGRVLAGDRQVVWGAQVGQTGYLAGDFNLDGSVLANDLQLLWKPNVGAESAVPGVASRPPPPPR